MIFFSFHQKPRRKDDQAEWASWSVWACRTSQKEKQLTLQTPDRLYTQKLQIRQSGLLQKLGTCLKIYSQSKWDLRFSPQTREACCSLPLTTQKNPKRFHRMLWSSFWGENTLVLCYLSEHHSVHIPGPKQKLMILLGNEINGKGVTLFNDQLASRLSPYFSF